MRMRDFIGNKGVKNEVSFGSGRRGKWHLEQYFLNEISRISEFLRWKQ